MIVLGIDPGLQATGTAVSELNGSSFKIKCLKEVKTKASRTLAQRLNYIYSSLEEIIDKFRPQTVVLEKIYSHYRHPATSGLLGHVRGVIVLLAAQKGLKIIEYPSTQVKKAVTSYGAASKEQIKRMVSYLAKLDRTLDSQHIADALALVLTYLHTLKHR